MGLLYIDDKESFDQISNDEDLNTFFTSFTQHYIRICTIKEKNKNKKIEELRPKLDDFNSIIDNLEKSGISVTKVDKLIDYIQRRSPFHIISAVDYAKILCFNEINLDETDFAYMVEHCTELEKNVYYLENKYKKWKKENKNLEKNLKKLEKEDSKLTRDIYEQMTLDRDLDALKKKLNYGKRLEEKLKFMQGHTLEQRKLLVELYNTVNTLDNAYKKFNLGKIEINDEASKDAKNNEKEAYDEMINNSLAMIDIDNITKKIFRILLKSELKELKQEYLGIEVSETEEESFPSNINETVVNWFINQNKEKILDLFKGVFAEVENLSETISEKVLKK